MKTFLYVSAFFPRKGAGHAGGRVAFENLIALQKDGRVDAVVCTSEDTSVCSARGITVVRQTKLALIAYLAKNLRTLSWHALLAAPVIHTRLNQKAERVIAELIRIHDYDEVFVDFTQCLLLVNRAMARAGKKQRVTACLPDVFAQRLIRSRRFIDVVLTGLVCRQERELIGSLDRIVALCEKDRQLLQSLYSATSIDVKPFTAPEWTANVDRSAGRVDPTKLVFFGNFDRIENSSAARWFVTSAMPDIRAAIPGVRLTLVGTGSDRLAAQIGSADVVGTGFVENPAEHFSSCACAIAPLFEGAGVKFKVLEALACGVPVIGTAVACEGIAQQPMLVRAESGTFAAETTRILQMSRGAQSFPAA